MSSKTVNYLLVFSIVITIVYSVLLFLNTQNKERNVKLVAHTYEVIQKSTELLSTMKDAETGQRGYLLTGKDIYLAPYHKAVSKIQTELTDLQKITSYNTIQKQNLNELNILVKNKIRELENTVELYKRGSEKAAFRIIEADSNEISIDKIRNIIDKMLIEENRLLELRTAKLEHNFFRSDLITLIGLLFIATISVLAIFFISKKNTENNVLLKQINGANLELNIMNDKLNQYNEKLEDKIKLRTKEIEQTNRKLIEANIEKNNFLGMAAHDLKSPLNHIKGLINIILMDINAFSEEQKMLLQNVYAASNKMTDLIKNLLDINKIEQGMTNAQFEEVNVHDLINMSVYSFKELAKHKNIKLVFKSTAKAEVVKTDKQYLNQILENLVSNAIKFTFPDKNIFITLTKLDTKIRIEIQDEGQGILESELPFLFEKFKKLSSKPTGGENSTGLGLSIVKQLVEKLQGEITCKSTHGLGTTFIVDLPVIS